MDYLPLPSQAILGLLAVVLVYNLWIVIRSKATKNRYMGAPEPAGGWPIVGHLTILGGPGTLARRLGSMADKYGSAMMIRLGMRPVIVISSWELAKECLTTNDKAFASRVRSDFCKYLGYNYAMFGMAPYGPYWREMRKVVTVHLLSNRRVESLQHVWAAEIDVLVKELYRVWAKEEEHHHQQPSPPPVEMKRRLGLLTFNVVAMIVIGKRYSGDDNEMVQFCNVVHEWMHVAGAFVASEVFPFLKWLDDRLDLQGHKRAMRRTAMKLDSFLTRWLEEHRRKRRSGEATVDRDFMDMMISVMESADISEYDPDTIIKATAATPLMAGDETTSTALIWAISLLVNHPNVLRKAQEEVDAHIGMDRNVEPSDIKNLVYLQAIVKETLRLYPSAPLSVPHEATHDCNVGGFHVQAGTQLWVNIWKIHRDPRVWYDASEFQPERFLSSSHAHVDAGGQHFEFIPFGSGRRMCPGASLALHMVHLTLARLIHGFEMKAQRDGPIDMTESTGLSMPKATPLEVSFTPRLSSKLYE